MRDGGKGWEAGCVGWGEWLGGGGWGIGDRGGKDYRIEGANGKVRNGDGGKIEGWGIYWGEGNGGWGVCKKDSGL